MEPDVAIHRGKPDRPLSIFVHGLGVNRRLWTDPSLCRVMGGLFPLASVLPGYDLSRTLFHDLMDQGHTVAAWSQRRPVGPLETAVRELSEVISTAREVPHRGLILIGHSRGGLVARAAAESMGRISNIQDKLIALVTLSSPHHGTDMAKWAGLLSPLASALNPHVPEAGRGRLMPALKRLLNFLESRGVRELLPGSDVLSSFSETAPPGAYCLSLGGTDPALVRIPGLMPLPESIERLLSGRVLPDEMRRGRGDGLVSARSAVLPYADAHLDFPVNHAAMVVDPAVRLAVVQRLRRACQ